MYNDFKKSGIIHKIIQTKIKENYDNFKTALDIVNFIEDNIRILTKYDNNKRKRWCRIFCCRKKNVNHTYDEEDLNHFEDKIRQFSRS